MKFSENFTLNELLESDTATRLELTEQFDPPQAIINNLESLCVNILEPIRTLVGKPVTISSGYRCPRLNSKIGGANASQHTVGQAADIRVNGVTTEDLYQLIKKSSIPYSQLIEEFGRWIHVSYDHSGKRSNLIAKKINGITTYFPDTDGRFQDNDNTATT